MAPTSKGKAPSQEQVDALKAQVLTSETLLKRLYVTLSEIMMPSNPQHLTTANKTHVNDPIQLVNQSSSLIKAHTTKLALLMITEPFTPSAIIRIIADLVNTPVLTIVSGAQALDGTRYTNVFRQGVVSRCAAVLRQLCTLLDMMPTDGKALKPDDFTTGKGSLVATSKTIAACDETMKYVSKGVQKNLAAKVGEWRDTLDDQLRELQEWEQESDDDDDDDDEDDEDEDEDSDGEGNSTNKLASKDYHSALDNITQGIASSHLGQQQPDPQALLDELTATLSIPKDDPQQIRPRLHYCIKNLAQLTKLYEGIIAHRLNRLPQFPAPPRANIPARIDEIMVLLKKIPDMIGDLAEAFYQLDPAAIDQIQDRYLLSGLAVVDLVALDWEGKKDNFTNVKLRAIREELKHGKV